jgi:hypothetical protein
VFSFGVLLWEVYTSGERPYGPVTDAEVHRSVGTARPNRALTKADFP